jgi:hypothetical protein
MYFDKIYVNGCSFSCAGGLNWEEVKFQYKNKLNILIDNHLDFAYPTIVAKELNIPITNESAQGGSLNRLIRMTYEYIYKNDVSKTLFILELPPMWRDELYSFRLNRLMNITWGVIKNPNTDKTEIANGYNSKDINYVYRDIINYFDNFVNIDFETDNSMNNLLGLLSKLLDCCDFESFLKTHNLKKDYDFVKFDGKSINNWFKDEKLSINDELGINIDNHLGIEGNKIAANILLKNII